MSALPTALAASLEFTINQVLRLDPESLARVQNLQGKVIGIEISGPDIAFYLLPDDRGLNVFSHFEGAVDTVLRGTPLGMARMGLTKRPGDMLLRDEVQITGNVELGQQLRDILDHLDIDWEEQLSHLTGDIVAHQLGELARGVLGWGRKTADILAHDGAEYIQEESRDVVTRSEVDEYITRVDALTADMERLAARIARLAHPHRESHSGDRRS